MSYGGEGVARMRVLQVVVLIVFGVIAARLAYIQLIDSKYEELARGNALRYEVQYPSRGEVFDRNGEYLVQSRECYDLMVIYREMDREGFDIIVAKTSSTISFNSLFSQSSSPAFAR